MMIKGETWRNQQRPRFIISECLARAELEVAVRQLKSKLEEAENKLKSTLKEKQFTEAVRRILREGPQPSERSGIGTVDIQ